MIYKFLNFILLILFVVCDREVLHFLYGQFVHLFQSLQVLGPDLTW